MNVETTRFDAIVMGAGIAGLTAAARLGLAGRRVLVVERHNVPGGCASFFQRGAFRFDVGATLVGGFGERGLHRRMFADLGMTLTAERLEPAMVVHLPGARVERWGDERWRGERLRVFGSAAERFWRQQEALAESAWDFSSRLPALPIDLAGGLALGRALRPRHLPLALARGRALASIVPPGGGPLRTFLDLQLLITSQANVSNTDLAYGATALDLAREGCFHLAGGVADIAIALARAVRRLGSSIAYNAEVARIDVRRGAACGVTLRDGRGFEAPRIIAAVPVQSAAAVCPELARAWRARLDALPERWGAFMLYVGLQPGVVPDSLPLHHQTLADADRPLGEGNSVFLSLSAPGELGRARNGGRAVTLSTHTEVSRWEQAAQTATTAGLRGVYQRRLLDALERVIPGAFEGIALCEAAVPATFARYTGRFRGLVGGFPQTPAFAGLGGFSHRTPLRGLFLCGDSAFPGQSTVGATLSGYNAARAAVR